MRIIGYAYEADCHCVSCALRAFHDGAKDLSKGLHHPPTTITPRFFKRDEHGLPVDLVDNEGNPIHPMFSTDEQLEPQYCGDCHERIS